MSQMTQMSRGEMIRRLDTAVRDVHDHLENGPLTADERHALATSLSRLLPIVADTLQDQEDTDAANALVHHGEQPTTTPSDRADLTLRPTTRAERERSAHAETCKESPPRTTTAPPPRPRTPS